MIKKAKVRSLRYSFEVIIFPEIHRRIIIRGKADPRIALKLQCDQIGKEMPFILVEAMEESIDQYCKEALYLNVKLDEIIHGAMSAAYQEAVRFTAKGIRHKFSMSASDIAKELEEEIKKRLGARHGGSVSNWNEKYRMVALADYNEVHNLLKGCWKTISNTKGNRTNKKVESVHAKHTAIPINMIEAMIRKHSTPEELALEDVGRKYGVSTSYFKKQLSKARREAKSRQ